MGKGGARGSVLDMEFPVEVWLASERVPLGRLLDLKLGDCVPLSDRADESVDLVANGNTLASGELVVVDGKFGIRITKTASARLARLEEEGAAQEQEEEAAAPEAEAAAPEEEGS